MLAEVTTGRLSCSSEFRSNHSERYRQIIPSDKKLLDSRQPMPQPSSAAGEGHACTASMSAYIYMQTSIPIYTYLPTYSHLYLPTHRSIPPSIYLSNCQSACIPTYLTK